MIVTDLLVWWYGAAWVDVLKQVFGRAERILVAFSVGLLARTLFAPFRQIDAGQVRGSLEVQLHAWFDRTFSRVIGFLVRSIMICTGCLAAALAVAAGIVWAILWVLIPVLPAVGIFLMLTGWTVS